MLRRAEALQEDPAMTKAVTIYEILSQTIEDVAKRRPVERPELAFGKIGIAAVAAALAAGRFSENDRPLHASRLPPQAAHDATGRSS
jgi:hypothetical protein